MKRIQIGARVRLADEAVLAAALRGPAGQRPEPGQMLWAGRHARVAGYRRGATNGSSYVLRDAPGLWLADWIDPI